MNNTEPTTAPEFPIADLTGKRTLITGGTGSFGQAFVRHVLQAGPPERLVILSRDEQKQFDMGHEFAVDAHPGLRYFIGDVRDQERLEMAMRDIDIVVHAAALKHVSIAEYNPFECVHTNVLGAENVVRAAINAGVEKVVALSTDKAGNPINLYGASKLASDKIFVAANHLSGKGGTRFSVVRYGNVLGSRGSVVSLFKRLIEEGAEKLPVTDPSMTRFIITLREGVDFVLSSLEMMRGGEIFIPRIPSVRLADLVEAIANDTEIEHIGLRPGEKLHEVLISEDDARSTVDLGDRYVIEPAIHLYEYESFVDQNHPFVETGFRYSSDSNDVFLDVPAIRALLEHEGCMPVIKPNTGRG